MVLTLIFPHQLFEDHPALQPGHRVLLFEEGLFFQQYPFHVQKILLHRATMKYYQEFLRKKGYAVEYRSGSDSAFDLKSLFADLALQHIREVHLADPVDYLLRRRLERYARQYQIHLTYHPTPNFIHKPEEFNPWFDRKGKYFLTEYYIDQRKQTGLLMHEGKPEGGKWTYDQENRKKLPLKLAIPSIPVMTAGHKLDSVTKEVQAQFRGNYGALGGFNYALTHADAEKALDQFLVHRFSKYGTYQDAIHPDHSFLFHSLLTPALNIGLVDPRRLLTKVVDYAKSESLPLNETEGFVRQVLGWREFIRAVYEREGVRQRTRNFWGFTHPMPPAFWNGTTGIPPVDRVIHRLLETGYSNHIERLMILGNFMCLCEIAPDEVYRWFMTLYIDAYDWVMVPNVYGMSQFADGGLMSTKPYISGSNYILKMSHYPKGDWCAIWDGLFWRFMHRHRDFFSKNPRLSMLLGTLDRMSPELRKRHLDTAEDFLNKIHSA